MTRLHTSRRITLLAGAAAIAACALPTGATAKAPGGMIKCDPVNVRDTHGGEIRDNAQLTLIRNGRVLTLNPNTGVSSKTPFTKRSGRWLTSRSGKRYAVANQWISAAGRPGGDLLIATPAPKNGRIPCSPRTFKSTIGPLASAADTSSTTADGSLPGMGFTEVAGSTTNVSGKPLENYATRIVYLSTSTHPDGAKKVSDVYPYGYTALGAAMNDSNGVERYSPAQGGLYIDDPYHRHFIIYNGSTVAAAKRPATKPDGTVLVSPLAWRTVAKNATIAN